RTATPVKNDRGCHRRLNVDISHSALTSRFWRAERGAMQERRGASVAQQPAVSCHALRALKAIKKIPTPTSTNAEASTILRVSHVARLSPCQRTYSAASVASKSTAPTSNHHGPCHRGLTKTRMRAAAPNSNGLTMDRATSTGENG